MWTRKKQSFERRLCGTGRSPLKNRTGVSIDVRYFFSISLQSADSTALMLQKCNYACFIRKVQNTRYNKKHFVYWWFIPSISCMRGESSRLISFLLKCKLDSLPSQTQSPRSEPRYWHASERCASLLCWLPGKRTCRRWVFFRFWSPSFKVWTWLFSCCLSSELLSSSASRCFSSSLIFNSCCSDRGEQWGSEAAAS